MKNQQSCESLATSLDGSYLTITDGSPPKNSKMLDGVWTDFCLLPAGRAPRPHLALLRKPGWKAEAASYLGRGWCPQSSRGWWSGCCSHWSTEVNPGCSSGCPAGGPETGPMPVPHKPPSPPRAAGGRKETLSSLRVQGFKVPRPLIVRTAVTPEETARSTPVSDSGLPFG